jgi:hypothetical protein
MEDSMMNATPISSLPSPPMSTSGGMPPPMKTNVGSNPDTSASGTSYADLLKGLDIAKQNQPQQQPMQYSSQVSQSIQQQAPQYNPVVPIPTQQQQSLQYSPTIPSQPQNAQYNSQQFASQPVQTTSTQMLQSPVNPSAEHNVMQQMHDQASMYGGGMPQSAPISEYLPMEDTQIYQGPLKSDLLPDPMFFQNPPPKTKKIYIEKKPEPKKSFFGFDQTKLKNALLVAAIVFFLISYGAPMLAQKFEWAIHPLTGKFTSYGLVVISAITGLLYLGITALIERFGNGV